MIAAIENGRPRLKETHIVRQIMDYLAIRQIPFVHHRNTGVIKGRNGGLQFCRQREHQRGIADLIVMWRGNGIAIEVKTPIGRVSPEQTDWLKRWQNAGGLVLVARSVDAVEAYFDELNTKPPRI